MVLLSVCVVAVCASIRRPYWFCKMVDERTARLRERKALRGHPVIPRSVDDSRRNQSVGRNPPSTALRYPSLWRPPWVKAAAPPNIPRASRNSRLSDDLW